MKEKRYKSLMTEGAESRNMKLAKHYLYDNYNYSEGEAMKLIGSIKTDIPNVRLAKCKFILGVTRMFKSGDLNDEISINGLNKTLKYVASDAHINEYDNNLNNLTCEELIKRFSNTITADLEKEKSELSQMEFNKSDYEIVKIPNFETAEQYGDYTSWCVTHYEDMYNTYTHSGLGLFYFCLKNGFENIEEVKGEGCPLDEYGLSMIAVSVNEDGSCNTITCRWNHDNGGNDNIMSTKELSQIIGYDFYQVFKPYTDEELEAKRQSNLYYFEEYATEYLNTYGEYEDEISYNCELCYDSEYDDDYEGEYYDANGEICDASLDFEGYRREHLKYIIVSSKIHEEIEERLGKAYLIYDYSYGDYTLMFDEIFTSAIYLEDTNQFILEKGNEHQLYDCESKLYAISGDTSIKGIYETNIPYVGYISKNNHLYFYDFKNKCIMDNTPFKSIQGCGLFGFYVRNDNNEENFYSIYKKNVVLNKWHKELQRFGRLLSALDEDGITLYYVNEQEGKVTQVTDNRVVSLQGFLGLTIQGTYRSGYQFDYIKDFNRYWLDFESGKIYELKNDRTLGNEVNLMNNDISEGRKSKKIYIDENKMNLFEGRESKHTNLAKKYWMNKHNCSQEDAMKVLGAIKHDIPNARLAQSKFLLGVTRLYDNGELRNGDSIMAINKLLHLIASDAHVNDYDSNLNDMSLTDLETRFEGLGRQEVDDRTSYLNGLEYTDNGYEVVRVPDFETARQYGDYTSWCVTQDEGMYNNYTHNGLGLFYFFLKNGFENVEEIEGEGCPLDEYGLSMIAVSVNDDGTLNTVTCRWNHDNGGNDAIMNDEELSKVIGMNVYNVCKPYTEEELEAKGIITFKKVPELLAQGVDPEDIFNNCYPFIEGFAVVEFNDKWNYLKEDGTLLSPNQWFDYVYKISNGFGIVGINSKWNYIKQDGTLLSPNQWFDNCGTFSEGFAVVQLNGESNYLKQDGTLLSPNQWFDYCNPFSEGFGMVELDNKENYIKEDGALVSPNLWFDNTFKFRNGFCIVELDGEENYIKEDGTLLSPNQWFDDCEPFRNGFAVVELNGERNHIKKDGTLLSPNQWFDDIYDFAEGFAVVQLNGKRNIIKQDGTLLSPNKWFDGCYNFSEGFAVVKLNEKWNYLKQDGTLLSPNQWFDECGTFREGFAVVELNDKWYRVSQNGVLCDYNTKEPIEQLSQTVSENTKRGKKIYINENKLSILKESQEEVTFYSFFTQVKNFLKQLLTNPSSAEPSDILKKHGLNKDILISKLKKRGLLKSDENITEVPIDEAKVKNPLGMKLRAKYTIKYSVPRKDFEKNMHRLYAELFESEWKIKSVLGNEKEEIQKILDNDIDGAYKNRGGYKIQENSENEISSKFIQRAIQDKFSDDDYNDVSERDKRIRDMRYKAVDKYNDEHPNYHSGLSNEHRDNEWLEKYSQYPLKILDSDYNSLEDLYDGVKSGRLLIHCREMQGIEDGLSTIYPEAGQTVQDAYGADYAECEREIEELVFASDNFNWAHNTRNGIYFIESDNFQRSLGDGRVQYPNGEISDYYLNDIPLTVESGDWYSDEPADVVAYMDIKNTPINEDTLPKIDWDYYMLEKRGIKKFNVDSQNGFFNHAPIYKYGLKKCHYTKLQINY